MEEPTWAVKPHTPSSMKHETMKLSAGRSISEATADTGHPVPGSCIWWVRRASTTVRIFAINTSPGPGKALEARSWETPPGTSPVGEVRGRVAAQASSGHPRFGRHGPGALAAASFPS